MGAMSECRRAVRLIRSDRSADTIFGVVLLVAVFGPTAYKMYREYRRGKR